MNSIPPERPRWLSDDFKLRKAGSLSDCRCAIFGRPTRAVGSLAHPAKVLLTRHHGMAKYGLKRTVRPLRRSESKARITTLLNAQIRHPLARSVQLLTSS